MGRRKIHFKEHELITVWGKPRRNDHKHQMYFYVKLPEDIAIRLGECSRYWSKKKLKEMLELRRLFIPLHEFEFIFGKTEIPQDED